MANDFIKGININGAEKFLLASGIQYGDELPQNALEGSIFLKEEKVKGVQSLEYKDNRWIDSDNIIISSQPNILLQFNQEDISENKIKLKIQSEEMSLGQVKNYYFFVTRQHITINDLKNEFNFPENSSYSFDVTGIGNPICTNNYNYDGNGIYHAQIVGGTSNTIELYVEDATSGSILIWGKDKTQWEEDYNERTNDYDRAVIDLMNKTFYANPAIITKADLYVYCLDNEWHKIK